MLLGPGKVENTGDDRGGTVWGFVVAFSVIVHAIVCVYVPTFAWLVTRLLYILEKKKNFSSSYFRPLMDNLGVQKSCASILPIGVMSLYIDKSECIYAHVLFLLPLF